MDSTKIVGEKIKSLRETKEISVAELAVRSGLAEEQIPSVSRTMQWTCVHICATTHCQNQKRTGIWNHSS